MVARPTYIGSGSLISGIAGSWWFIPLFREVVSIPVISGKSMVFKSQKKSSTEVEGEQIAQPSHDVMNE